MAPVDDTATRPSRAASPPPRKSVSSKPDSEDPASQQNAVQKVAAASAEEAKKPAEAKAQAGPVAAEPAGKGSASSSRGRLLAVAALGIAVLAALVVLGARAAPERVDRLKELCLGIAAEAAKVPMPVAAAAASAPVVLGSLVYFGRKLAAKKRGLQAREKAA
mmetsp:Transcript_17406/g.39409  ORF Transcript_17406/g.39409 Transcript_17406/m.39409 type:complete len:163 (-) Transcript_17406:150-638(-)